MVERYARVRTQRDPLLRGGRQSGIRDASSNRTTSQVDEVPHTQSITDHPTAWRKLFLLRRLSIRLGFDGEVASPEKGWASSSPVGEFSAKHNSFRD
jgi:hypothetical protein